MGALILQSDWPPFFLFVRTDKVERGSISVTVGPSGSGPAEPGVRAHGRREGGWAACERVNDMWAIPVPCMPCNVAA